MCTLYYMIIKDSMVIIHLAKITLLEISCDYFKEACIPKKVYEEIIIGKDVYPEVKVIQELVDKKKITVKKVSDKNLLKKTKEFNLYRGEAETVALYWQEKAKYLASDDDNVRKKSVILDIKIIGTPVIILKLYKEKVINKTKFMNSLGELKRIGWFNNAVIDKILMEAK